MGAPRARHPISLSVVDAETGYFAILPIAFDALLVNHDLLAIPAGVFGANRPDLSVASCLYDIELHDGKEAGLVYSRSN